MRSKFMFLFVLPAFAAMAFALAGCPVNEEKEEKDIPEMTCERAMEYHYEICGYTFSGGTAGDGSLTLEEAIDSCESFEFSEADWEGSRWQCVVLDCADPIREPEKCDAYKACIEECFSAATDDDTES